MCLSFELYVVKQQNGTKELLEYFMVEYFVQSNHHQPSTDKNIYLYILYTYFECMCVNIEEGQEIFHQNNHTEKVYWLKV